MSANFCQNCGAKLAGAYCGQCGKSGYTYSSARDPITFNEPSTSEISPGRKILWGFFLISFMGLGWLYFSETDADKYYRQQGMNSITTPAPTGPKPFVITITGTEGTPFHGSYMTMQKNGQSNTRSVSGHIPQTYQTSGEIVSISFQKEQQGGEMKVFIESKGVPLNSENTSAPYGVVTITAQ